MVFEDALVVLQKEYPGYRWLVKCSDDGVTFWARIESPDFEAVQWTAGDATKIDVIAGRDSTSGWCASPAEAILHAIDVMECREAQGRNHGK